MEPVSKSSSLWMLAFALKILACIGVLNIGAVLVLWILGVPSLLILILVYEGLFTAFLGVLQILSSLIYRENSVTQRSVRAWGGARTAWFDFRRFAKLKTEERQKYRQEGAIMVLIGFMLLLVSIAAHFYML